MLDRSYVTAAEDAYIECALWTEESQLDEDAAQAGLDVLGLHADTDAELRADLRAFLADEEVATTIARAFLDAGQVGHDFWLTRNRHGAGFWDRGLGEVGDRLTKAAHAYGEVNLYLGDDGFIHQS